MGPDQPTPVRTRDAPAATTRHRRRGRGVRGGASPARRRRGPCQSPRLARPRSRSGRPGTQPPLPIRGGHHGDMAGRGGRPRRSLADRSGNRRPVDPAWGSGPLRGPRAGHAAVVPARTQLLTLESTPRSSLPVMGSTAAIERGLRVGELAEAVGATSDTIRYYERAGLLPPPRRTPAGYRAYDVLAVDRLRFIQGAQRLGLRLADIRDLLSVRDTGSCACGPAEDLLAQRLAEVDAEIARLSALRREMLTMLDGLTGADCPPPAPGTWFPPSQGEVKPMALDVIDTCCDDCPPEACSSGCC